MQKNISGWEVLVDAGSVLKSLLFAFCALVATLPSEVLKLPISLPLRKFPSVQKLFFLCSSLVPTGCRSYPDSFVCFFFFFLISFALPCYVKISLPF